MKPSTLESQLDFTDLTPQQAMVIILQNMSRSDLQDHELALLQDTLTEEYDDIDYTDSIVNVVSSFNDLATQSILLLSRLQSKSRIKLIVKKVEALKSAVAKTIVAKVSAVDGEESSLKSVQSSKLKIVSYAAENKIELCQWQKVVSSNITNKEYLLNGNCVSDDQGATIAEAEVVGESQLARVKIEKSMRSEDEKLVSTIQNLMTKPAAKHILPVYDCFKDVASECQMTVTQRLDSSLKDVVAKRALTVKELFKVFRALIRVVNEASDAALAMGKLNAQNIKVETDKERGAIKTVKIDIFESTYDSNKKPPIDDECMAPEVKSEGKATKAADIYSVGRIMQMCIDKSFECFKGKELVFVYKMIKVSLSQREVLSVAELKALQLDFKTYVKESGCKKEPARIEAEKPSCDLCEKCKQSDRVRSLQKRLDKCKREKAMVREMYYKSAGSASSRLFWLGEWQWQRVEWSCVETPAKMPYKVGYQSSNVYDGKVYVVGGYGCLSSEGSNQVLDVIQVFDVNNNKWHTSNHKLPAARHNHTSYIIGDELYVIGGTRSACVESLNMVSGAWRTKMPLTEAKSGHTSSLIASDKIAVFGGGSSTSVSVYNSVTNVWSQSAATLATDAYLASEYVGEQLYVIGGNSNPTRVASWDPIADVWTIRPNLTQNFSYHMSVALDRSTIVVAGGVHNAKMVVMMDVRESKWQVMKTQLKEGRRLACSVGLEGRKMMLFGGYQDSIGACLDDVEVVDMRV